MTFVYDSSDDEILELINEIQLSNLCEAKNAKFIMMIMYLIKSRMKNT